MLFYQAFPVVHRGKWGLVIMACCCCMHVAAIFSLARFWGLAILFSRLRDWWGHGTGALATSCNRCVFQCTPPSLGPRTSNLEPRTSNLEPRTSNLETHELSKGLLCMVVDEKGNRIVSQGVLSFSFLLLGE